MNLGELIQGYFVSKIKEGSASIFFNSDCNCNSATELNDTCAYKGECNKCCIVYKVTCKCFYDLFIVNTQNTLKNNGTILPTCGPKGNT